MYKTKTERLILIKVQDKGSQFFPSGADPFSEGEANWKS